MEETFPGQSSEPSTSTVVRVPGATQRYGGIELFTLSAHLTSGFEQSRQSHLIARQGVLQPQTQAADSLVDHLTMLSEKLANLETVSEMEVARMNMRLGKAGATRERSSQDLLTNAKVRRGLPETFHWAWCDEPASLVGTGWRYAAPPTPEMIRLCIPVADALRQAAGRGDYLALLVEEAELQLNLLEGLRESGHTNEAEITLARGTWNQARFEWAREKKRKEIAELQHRILLRGAGLEDLASSPRKPPSAQQVVREADAALDRLPHQRAWFCGLLRLTENRLLAIAHQQAAREALHLASKRHEALSKVPSAREVERKRADLALRKAEALVVIARQDPEVWRRSFDQWTKLAQQAPSSHGTPHWLETRWLEDGQEILEAKLRAEQEALAAAEAAFNLQAERVSLLKKIENTAASQFEVTIQSLGLAQLEGEVAAVQHRIYLLHESKNLLTSSRNDLRAASRLQSVADLPANSRAQLMKLAADLEGPNPGTVFRLKAARELIGIRTAKLEALYEKGFASKREIADARTQFKILDNLVIAESAKQATAVASKELIASLVPGSEEAISGIPSSFSPPVLP